MNTSDYNKLVYYAKSILVKRGYVKIEPEEIVNTAFLKAHGRSGSTDLIKKMISNSIIELRAEPKFISFDRVDDPDQRDALINKIIGDSSDIYSLAPKKDGTRMCILCGEFLHLSEFYCNLKKNKYWCYSSYCKKCHLVKCQNRLKLVRLSPDLYEMRKKKNNENQKWRYAKKKNDPYLWEKFKKYNNKKVRAWELANPEKTRSRLKRFKAKSREFLADNYIRDILLRRYNKHEITNELIESTRLRISKKRNKKAVVLSYCN